MGTPERCPSYGVGCRWRSPAKGPFIADLAGSAAGESVRKNFSLNELQATLVTRVSGGYVLRVAETGLAPVAYRRHGLSMDWLFDLPEVP